MKKLNLTTRIILVTLMFIQPVLKLAAQTRGNGFVETETRELPQFSKIEVGGAFKIFFKHGNSQEVKIETDGNLLNNIITRVSGNTLSIEAKSIKDPAELNVFVVLPVLEAINISGAAQFRSNGAIISDMFEIEASGASEVVAEVEVDELITHASGATIVKLTGSARTHEVHASGAARLKAQNLDTFSTEVEASGASDAVVNSSNVLVISTSGAASVSHIEEPEKLSIITNDDAPVREDKEEYIVYTENDGERVRVKTMGVEVYNNDDTTEIKIGKHRLVVDDCGNVKWDRKTRQRFNGHWAGLDIGINGYLNANRNMDFETEDSYLDLLMHKSIFFSINFFEQNFRFTSDQKWGIVTGMGWEFHNYRFSNDVMITSDSSSIKGFYTQNVNMRKSKLTTNYLTVPVLFEFQTNRYSKKNSFHITAGIIAGLRISTHTKRYFEETNKEYELLDPVSREVVLTATSPGNKKVKDWDDFYLNPFKVDATVRIGWGWINLFGNYSLTTLFREGKGPELYPFSAGITLVTW